MEKNSWGKVNHEEPPTSIRIDRAVLHVSDLEISKVFYQETLGLRVMFESLHPFRYASMARNGKVVLTLEEQTHGRFKIHRQRGPSGRP